MGVTCRFLTKPPPPPTVLLNQVETSVTRQACAFTSRIHKCSNCCIFVTICAYSILHFVHI